MATFEVKKKWTSDGAAVEDSNMALVGSDLDKEARKAAASNEAAWAEAGKEPGIQIWRVEKMKIVEWPKQEYGKFYMGDSYIVLHTRKDPGSDKLLWDIHFWLGKTTTQDEMGVAAYKTVELDDFLDQAPIQHREVQQHESQQFTKIFKQIEYWDGGIDSGFNKVEAGAYTTKLLRVRKLKHTIKVAEMPCTRDSLNAGDCFILDTGTALYPWFGEEASAFEKAKAGTVAHNISNKRHGKCKVVNEIDADFWAALGGEGPVKSAAEGEDHVDEDVGEGILYKLSDETGKLMCTEVGRGDLTKSMLGSDDVYILDAGIEVFVYIGGNASDAEYRSAMSTAVSYCGTTEKPLWTPIHVFKEGTTITNELWKNIFSN
ncbi:hypothetical protein CTAYLR_008877 [Chrysophaeum taylorii]|uniref:Gelsolin-like domain-containing protein n=1 Tax=Chrysophaeum taylorii TaxID=2483200 RepID=A0AAD7U8F4_9STRA|nr:hypothetical protein CTAYLR_008877 [Chrysophaeum taylorii]